MRVSESSKYKILFAQKRLVKFDILLDKLREYSVSATSVTCPTLGNTYFPTSLKNILDHFDRLHPNCRLAKMHFTI